MGKGQVEISNVLENILSVTVIIKSFYNLF
jgi:hypothetical protein